MYVMLNDSMHEQLYWFEGGHRICATTNCFTQILQCNEKSWTLNDTKDFRIYPQYVVVVQRDNSFSNEYLPK